MFLSLRLQITQYYITSCKRPSDIEPERHLAAKYQCRKQGIRSGVANPISRGPKSREVFRVWTRPGQPRWDPPGNETFSGGLIDALFRLWFLCLSGHFPSFTRYQQARTPSAELDEKSNLLWRERDKRGELRQNGSVPPRTPVVHLSASSSHSFPGDGW